MIPMASAERIARKAGANRISNKAIKELANCIEDIGMEIALEAAQAARHAKRKTILKEDVKLVADKA